MQRRAARSWIAPLLAVLVTTACGTGDRAVGPSDATPDPTEQTAGPRWERIDGQGPSARTDHVLASTADAVYLFGGRSGRQELGDLWRFDSASGRWTQIEPHGEQPSPRFGPAFEASADGTLILFGGEARSTRTFFNDVWSFDPSAEAWTKLDEGGPSPRYGAGSAANGDGHLYVTHGFTASGRFDDTWSFGANGFTDRSGQGERPVARCLLRAAYHDGGLVIFGGQSNPEPYLNDLWRLDLAEQQWERLDPSQAPSPRNLYAAAQVGDAWWIHGGRSADGFLEDLWRLDLSSATFEQMTILDAPPARSGHAVGTVADGLVLFGGRGTDGELADTWRLRF